MRKVLLAFAIGALIGSAFDARAVELKALISTAMKAPVEELVPKFERATGHKVVITYGPTGGLTKRVMDGETADIIILGGASVLRDDEGLGLLIKQGKVVGNNIGVARSMIGAAVAKGAPKPDISTEEKFKAVLLTAKSVAYTDAASGGSSGVYLGRLFDRMGLTEMLKPKAKLAAGGPNGYAATFVAKGEAEIALQPIPELMAVPGVDVVGPLPGVFQNVTTYFVRIHADAKQPAAAKALIDFLTAPAAATVYKSKGLEPG
jgi:molybdate transport system substrate-binding protein